MNKMLRFEDAAQTWVNRLLCEGLPKPGHTGEFPRVVFDVAWGKELRPGEVIDVDLDALRVLEDQMGGDTDSYNRIDMRVMPRAGKHFIISKLGSYNTVTNGMTVCGKNPEEMGQILIHENRHRHQFDNGAIIDTRYKIARGLILFSTVNYPIFGSLLMFSITGSAESARREYLYLMVASIMAIEAMRSVGLCLYRTHDLEVDARFAANEYDGSKIFSIQKAG